MVSTKEFACNARDSGLILSQEDLLEEEWQPTPAFLPRKSHGERSLAGFSPWGRKDWDTAEQLTLSQG